ncbi:unnamed protein product [Trifolium pratense]|uniref:Uncharacterized protein n=1 Tax=Trifolium pratense TaxID=57577 RepID=A0ACB0L7P0_TRIPR|nr:unnamed protein product [Trifolium pratense]
MEELDEDRLSSLPKIVLHRILSRLPEEDAARTSALSKAWLDTWYTFPILSFTASKFMEMSPEQPMEYSERMRKTLGFCNYVKRSILRFRDQNLAIKEFKLKMNSSNLRRISKDVDIWLKLACECGVEVIEYNQMVSVGYIGLRRYHVLPICVIEAKSITKLVLKGYIKIDPTFMNHSIKFTSLRVLSLLDVLLGDQHAINHLISFCPLIESITLSCCVIGSGDGTKEKLKSLSISGLQKLKSVEAIGIQDVSFNAPSLETLCYSPIYFYAQLKIDFDSCRNLKELSMWSITSTFFTDKWFLEQFPKFPFVESLKLRYCKMSERINISSVRLKVLELSHCSNLKEVNIDAPNLLSCEYRGDGASEPTISILRNSSQLEVNIHLNLWHLDLCNLWEFVQNIKPNNVLTSLSLRIHCPSNVAALDTVALQISSLPPSIKHLDVDCVSQNIDCVSENKHWFLSVVNMLLSCCCPANISFSVHSHSKEFIELFYETLMRRKEDECFCTSDNTTCWWHGLKDVKVTSSMEMNRDVFSLCISRNY